MQFNSYIITGQELPENSGFTQRIIPIKSLSDYVIDIAPCDIRISDMVFIIDGEVAIRPGADLDTRAPHLIGTALSNAKAGDKFIYYINHDLDVPVSVLIEINE